MKNRIIITLPLFLFVIGISIWNFIDEDNFNILWRWFAWSNQVLAAVSLWVSTAYLYHTNKHKWISLFTGIPALFMTAVVIIYILAEPKFALGRFIPYHIAVIVGLSITFLNGAFYLYKVIKEKHNVDIKEE